MHGHNRKLGTFFYGGIFRNFEHDGRPNNALLRIVPLLCCQKNPHYNLSNCRFHLEKRKEGTARHVVFTKFSVMSCYTLEASFFGYKNEQGRKVHFQLSDFENLGKTLLGTFHHYLPGKQHGLMYLVE